MTTKKMANNIFLFLNEKYADGSLTQSSPQTMDSQATLYLCCSPAMLSLSKVNNDLLAAIFYYYFLYVKIEAGL
jgi:hypothetical protein